MGPTKNDMNTLEGLFWTMHRLDVADMGSLLFARIQILQENCWYEEKRQNKA